MGKLIARILIAFGVSEATATKVGEIAFLAGILSVVMAIMSFLKRVVSYPLALGAIVVAFTLFPDTIGWIFLQIGNIQLKFFVLLLSQIMPDIVNEGKADFDTWYSIWQAGLDILPADLVEVLNSVGVAYLLGMITSTIVTISTIRIYRKVMIRAGLF